MKKLIALTILDYMENNTGTMLREEDIELIIGRSFYSCNEIYKKTFGVSIISDHKRIMLLDLLYYLYDYTFLNDLNSTFEEKLIGTYWSDRTSYGKAFKKQFNFSPVEFISKNNKNIEYLMFDLERPEVELDHIYINTLMKKTIESGLTFSELSQKSGISASTLYYYAIKKNSIISINHLNSLSKALKLKSNLLYEEIKISNFKKSVLAYDKCYLLNDFNRQIFFELFSDYGITVIQSYEYAFDSEHSWPELFIKEISYCNVNYELNCSFKIRSSALILDEIYNLQYLNYQIIYRNIHESISYYSSDSENSNNLNVLLVSLLSIVVEFGFVLGLSTSARSIYDGAKTTKLVKHFDNNAYNMKNINIDRVQRLEELSRLYHSKNDLISYLVEANDV